MSLLEAVVTSGNLIAGSAATLECTFHIDGTATAAGTPPTITVTRANGTVLVDDQAMTAGATGVYTFAIPAVDNTRVDTLTLDVAGTWTSVRAVSLQVEVVGEPLFTLNAVRTFDGNRMSDPTAYPQAVLLRARDEIADLLASWTDVSWIPRHARYTLDGSGTSELPLNHLHVTDLIAVTVDGTAYDLDDCTIVGAASNFLSRDTGVWPTGDRNIVVEYQHGHSGHPEGVTRIALLIARAHLVRDDIPHDAISYQGDQGGYQLVREGGPLDNATRTPEVNAWLSAHSQRIPVL